MKYTVRASVAIVVILTAVIAAQVADAAPPGNANFQRTWERTDKPVSDGAVSRTWMWGPQANSALVLEPYAESPGGQRTVQYYDKSRMEITHPEGDSSVIWYVTNGLLSKELITGQVQTGDNSFTPKAPAQINVAGDSDDPGGPTYATFTTMLNLPAVADGSTITKRVNRAGQITDDPSLASQGVTAAFRLTVPGIDHQVASPFWTFMNSTGTVYENNQLVDAPLFVNPFYATGYPITEAYWAQVKVAGTFKDVLMQCFERRCLTYTPGNPAGFATEAGNVGQHYYQWRYDGTTPPPAPTPTATNTAVATATSTPTPTPTETEGPGIVAVSASVSNSHPTRGSNVTVTGHFTVDGHGVAGVPMDTTWNYKTTTSYCSGTTSSSGTASCTRDIGGPTKGYTVVIDVVFTWQGETYYASTSFTPE